MVASGVLAGLLALMATQNAHCEGSGGGTQGSQWYVSPAGDDKNVGSLEKPFASIPRAKAEVARRRAAGAKGDLTVWIRDGVYRLRQALVFGPGDGGTAGSQVKYSAYQGEQVTVSGGRVLSGWTVGKDGAWRVSLPEVKAGKWAFRTLFVNGLRRNPARFPNQGYLRVAEVGEDKRTSFTVKAGELPAGAMIAGAELVFLHDWSISRIPIASYDEKTRVMKMATRVGPRAKHYRMDHYEPHPRYYLEGSASFLDRAGEWYLDRESGELSYLPMPGESMENTQVVAPFSKGLVKAAGTAEQPLENLWFHRINFEHAAWRGALAAYAAGQAGFHEESTAEAKNWTRNPISAAIDFEYLEGGGMVGGRVAHMEGSGVWIGAGCRGGRVEGMTITDIAGNGLMVGVTSSAPGLAAEKIQVKGNLIEACGRRYFGSIGIWVGMANHTQILHNEVRQMPYTGVSVGWMWNPKDTPCFANRVEGNHIHHVMQTLSDGGGIYTLGKQPGTILKGNVIHDVKPNAGRAESNGMFLDQGTTDIVIEGNLIYNIAKSPLRFHQAGVNHVRGNILVNEKDVPTIRYNATPEKNVLLENNRVMEQGAFDHSAPAVSAILDKAGVK